MSRGSLSISYESSQKILFRLIKTVDFCSLGHQYSVSITIPLAATTVIEIEGRIAFGITLSTYVSR